MIVYVSTERFATPARRLRRGLPPALQPRLRHLSYEELFFEQAGPIAHYIFTDFDRLTRFEIECVAAFVAALRAAAPDARVLNDPLRVLERTPLLAALHDRGINDFAVTRLDTGARPDRYPVFIRAEDGYGGPETEVLHNAAELSAALADLARRGLPLKGRIAVGYAAEPGPDGLFRKYSAYNIGGEVFSYHLLRARHWIIKRNFPLFDGTVSANDELVRSPEALAEELAFVRANPHAEELAEVFRIAGIDFGRVDYGMVGGRMAVYEINTNPNAPRGRRRSLTAERRAIVRQRIASAFERIDTPILARGRVSFRVSRPRVHASRMPGKRLPLSLMRKLADTVVRGWGAGVPASPGSPKPPSPSLTDPQTCGEDLAFNLAAISDLAKHHCVGCEDYHIMFVARRLTQSRSNIELDRPELSAIIGRLVRERLGREPGTAEILITGSADTGVLAATAHGVAMAGASALARTRFTVLDLCPTPLELCMAFARRHGLQIATGAVDLIADRTPRQADLVVVHSLFRHLPKQMHADVLRKFGGWLRPEGRVVFSNRLEDERDMKVRAIRRPEMVERLRHGVQEGALKIGESAEEFEARLARRARHTVVPVADYASLDELKALFAAARMPVHSAEVVTREVVSLGTGSIRSRAIAVLGAPRD